MTALRAGILVVFLALAAYLNSLGNGFAYDDNGIIPFNPVVTSGDVVDAATGPWWPLSMEGTGLYRPLTAVSFTVEWGAFEGDPLGFHLLNVLVHALVALLVFLLLLELGSVAGALAGGAVFAVHPLHTEAVANVVGRAELYAAVFFLAACLLYWKGRRWKGARRILRLLGLGLLYFLSLAGKEIGVTLPGVLLLLEVVAPRFLDGEVAPFAVRLKREAAVFLLLPVVLLGYLGLRFLALGTLSGEITAPIFQLLGPEARILTAIALWTQYVRLHVFPVDLAADYDPGVFFPSETVDLQVVLGAAVLVGLFVGALKAWDERPLVTLGLAWFAVTISPVSNVFFPTGTVLAERTLYLPSVGLSLVVAGLTPWLLSLPARPRRLGLALVVLWGLGAFLKTVDRNPSWISTFTVVQTLNEEHPESWRSIRGRAKGLERIGDLPAAAEGWDVAVRLAPLNYTLLVQAGDFHGRVGDWARGREYLNRAIGLWPTLANAYEILSENLLERGMGREGHRVALEGLARAGPDADLWALVSESYIMKGDLPAAVRARRAAIAADPEDGRQWARLGDLLEALGDPEGALEARARARELKAAKGEHAGAGGPGNEPALPPGGGEA